ncbi:6-phosphogluconate dehydrogenase, decarboxylating 1 [Spatholobus suberectus]|nr:6-phosphogluconate dehydrogenase, decarboxylating 1 [Spatholobus suberectus]
MQRPCKPGRDGLEPGPQHRRKGLPHLCLQLHNLQSQYTPRDFVLSLQHRTFVIILVNAGAPIDHTIAAFSDHLKPNDYNIDNNNEWYKNTEHRMAMSPRKASSTLA